MYKQTAIIEGIMSKEYHASINSVSVILNMAIMVFKSSKDIGLQSVKYKGGLDTSNSFDDLGL
jgi:hypothetical protein